MPDRCAYCGREEGDCGGQLHLFDCPVCGALACSLCLALVEFCEVLDNNTAQTWRGAICKIHVPWNIIESIKNKAKEDKEDGESS